MNESVLIVLPTLYVLFVKLKFMNSIINNTTTNDPNIIVTKNLFSSM